MSNYFTEENEVTKKIFDLDEILSFQLDNDVQVHRLGDFQYICYINGGGYGVGFTTMFALCCGIKRFKENHNKTQ